MKIHIKCINIIEFRKYQNKYKNHICFYNLKNDTKYMNLIKNKNNLYGYTFDLIDYTNERKKTMINNINTIKLSFIVENTKYNNIQNKCIQIFQPTKIESYIISKSNNNQIKFIHFGRINSQRYKYIINVAQLFPKYNIYLYGFNTLENYIKEAIYKFPNIKLINNGDCIYGNKIYYLIKDINTFVLSFSERPEYCYYSNRIPMLCGYRGLILQQYFNNIEKFFTNDELIIFKNINELKNKLNLLINNIDLQNKYRENAFKKSQLYSFDNYILKIINYIKS
jgi:hypothetical protein